MFEDASRVLGEAHAKLHAIEAAAQRFLDGHPYELTPELDVKTGIHHVRFHVLEEPPESLRLTFAECIQHARSSLDYVVNDLVASAGAPAKRNQFPIEESSAKYWGGAGAKSGKVGKGGTRNSQLISVPSKFLPYFDKLQPYQRGNLAPSDPLAVLKWLNDPQKHRHLQPRFMVAAVPSAPPQSFGLFNPTDTQQLSYKVQAGGMLKDGDELYSFRSDGLHGYLHPQLTVHVTFSSRLITTERLGTILGYIETDVLSVFRGLV